MNDNELKWQTRTLDFKKIGIKTTTRRGIFLWSTVSSLAHNICVGAMRQPK